MKNILVLTTLLLSGLIANAQEATITNNKDSQNFNEIKLNALFLVFGSIDLTYERTLNEDSGVGISVFLPIDEDVKDDINYYISPYYRMYFGKKYAAGFFIEGFGLLNSVNDFESRFTNGPDPILISEEKTTTDFALGIGLGGKWLTNSGFIGEINAGVGRNLFNANEANDLVGKLGVTVGYRF